MLGRFRPAVAVTLRLLVGLPTLLSTLLGVSCTGIVEPAPAREVRHDGSEVADDGEPSPALGEEGSARATGGGGDGVVATPTGEPAGGAAGGATPEDTAPLDTTDDVGSSGRPRDVLATDLRISEVSINQGVKITLMRDGDEVGSRNAPVVAGRSALLRVFVEPEVDFSPRDVTARVTLIAGGEEPRTLTERLRVSRASRDEDLEGSFNFTIQAEDIAAGLRYQVELLDQVGELESEGEGARFPEAGAAELDAQLSPPLHVTLVPVRYLGDGSGREVSLGAAEVEQVRTHLLDLLPLSDVEITVREPFSYRGLVLAGGGGWAQLLEACLSLRNADAAPNDEYYYCMFKPTADFGGYCRLACTAGMGPVAGPRDVALRAAIGLGYGDALGTLVHELGHTFGRLHAPCGGADKVDPSFPDRAGGVTTWGYRLSTGELLTPGNHTDFMGYCRAPWTSDYTYRRIFERLAQGAAAPRLLAATRDVLSIVVDVDGALSLGHVQQLSSLPSGTPLEVRYLDAGGGELAHAEGALTGLSHGPGGIVYLPPPPEGTAQIALEGLGTLSL